MTQSKTQNRKFVLAKRPKGAPDNSTLRLETEDVPTRGKGQMLLRLTGQIGQGANLLRALPRFS
jgi:NADPH-dependent curcumin reductase CurA